MIVRELLNLLSLEVDEASFQKGEEAALDVEKALAFIATAGAAAAVAVANLVEHVGQLVRGSQLIGVGTERLQEWGYAAAAVGSDFDNLAESILDLEDKVSDVATGGGQEYAQLLQKLGIRVTDTAGKMKSMEVLLPELADGFAKLKDGTERSGIASRLLGETGAKTLLPMFSRGAAGLREMAAEAKAMGVVLDEGTIRETMAFRSELGRTGAVLQSLAFGIGRALLPAVKDILVSIRAWVAENREVISSGFAVAMRLFSVAARVLVQALSPVVALLVWLAKDAGLARVALWGLALVLLFYAGNAMRSAIASAAAFIASMLAQITVTETFTNMLGKTTTQLRFMTLAEMRAAAVGAAAPYVIAAAWGALFIVLGLLIEDLYTFSKGGDSIMGRWAKWIGAFQNRKEEPGWFGTWLTFLKRTYLAIFDIQGAWLNAEKDGKRAFNSVVAFITEAFQGLERWLQGPASALTEYFRTLEKALRALFAGNFSELGGYVLDLLGPLGTVVRFFGSAWEALFQWLGGKFSGVGNFIGGIFKGLGIDVGTFTGGASGAALASPAAYVGSSANPAMALTRAASSSVSSSASTVIAPNQTIQNTITVGSTAQATEVATAVRKTSQDGWEQQLRSAQVALAGG